MNAVSSRAPGDAKPNSTKGRGRGLVVGPVSVGGRTLDTPSWLGGTLFWMKP
jgi:hypothetical protein